MRSRFQILFSLFSLFFLAAIQTVAAETNSLDSFWEKSLNCAGLEMDTMCFTPAVTDVWMASVSAQDESMQHQHSGEQQDHNMQMPGMNMGEEGHLVHPFFTHMGVPHPPGELSLRLSGLITRKQLETGEEGAAAAVETAPGEETSGDFAFHLEMGLTHFIGFHVRNDRARNEEHTEAMFQFAAFRSKDGMSGFSPEITIGIPSHSGVERWETTVGFTASLARRNFAVNEYIDYNPRSDEVENNSAFVIRVGKRFFPVFEYLVEKERGEPAVGSIVTGIKFRLNHMVTVGFGYQKAVTDEREFNWQMIGQSEFVWSY